MRPGFIAPTLAAKMSNTLDQALKGRVLINVVTGGFPVELAADGDFLDHDERYERTQEFMQVVRKAWTGGKAGTTKASTTASRAATSSRGRTSSPHPPFYFGGASDAAKKVGAEEADVYLLWGETVEMVRERIEDMKARAAAVGRTLRFGLRIHVVARETDEEARAAAEHLVSEIPERFQEMVDKHHAKGESEGEKRQRELVAAAEDGWITAAPLVGHRQGAARRRHGARRLRRERRALPAGVHRPGHRHVHPLRLPAPGRGAALRPVRDAALRRPHNHDSVRPAAA